jgi:hypothetical protein
VHKTHGGPFRSPLLPTTEKGCLKGKGLWSWERLFHHRVEILKSLDGRLQCCERRPNPSPPLPPLSPSSGPLGKTVSASCEPSPWVLSLAALPKPELKVLFIPDILCYPRCLLGGKKRWEDQQRWGCAGSNKIPSSCMQQCPLLSCECSVPHRTKRTERKATYPNGGTRPAPQPQLTPVI